MCNIIYKSIAAYKDEECLIDYFLNRWIYLFRALSKKKYKKSTLFLNVREVRILISSLVLEITPEILTRVILYNIP